MNFRGRAAGNEGGGMPLTPMIDVVFLLLCFFVTTQIFAQWETELDITLPTAESGTVPERLPGEVIVNILENGDVVVNGRTLDGAALEAMMEKLVALFPGQPVLLRADKLTAYEHIIRVLDTCRKADIWNVSFATMASE